MMFFPLVRCFIALCGLTLMPFFMTFFLDIDHADVREASNSSLQSELPSYNRIAADVYSVSGKLDYRLKASRLIMRAGGGFDAVNPDVDVVNHQQYAHSLTNNIAKPSQDLRIQSMSAYCTSDRLLFDQNVKITLYPSGSSPAMQSRPRFVNAQQLNYSLHDRYFEASGKVYYCYGVEEVFADKARGVIDDDDYTFDHGKIIFNKRPRC